LGEARARTGSGVGASGEGASGEEVQSVRMAGADAC